MGRVGKVVGLAGLDQMGINIHLVRLRRARRKGRSLQDSGLTLG